MGSEKYDIIFQNQVLQWIPNKHDAFKNMFSSLKAGGKIAVQYIDSCHPFLLSAYEVLCPPAIEERCKNMFHCVPRTDVDRLCEKVGFNVVKSYHTNGAKCVFESMEDFLKWLWSSIATHGVFDLQVVTQERIQRFLSRMGNPPFDLTADNINSRLIAVKPKEQTKVNYDQLQ